MQTIDTYVLLNKKQPLIIKIFTLNTLILMIILMIIFFNLKYTSYIKSSSNTNNNMYQRYHIKVKVDN